MYIIRDIFQLKFGHFKDAKALLEEATKKGMMSQADSMRVLSDFTGDSYRLIMERNQKSLADFEDALKNTMGQEDWQHWYEKFKEHVESSHREILKQVM